MASVYRKRFTKPLPPGAVIVTRDGHSRLRQLVRQYEPPDGQSSRSTEQGRRGGRPAPKAASTDRGRTPQVIGCSAPTPAIGGQENRPWPQQGSSPC